MNKTADVIIIGGGIVGACTAYRLAKDGANVVLLEKRHCGAGASGCSAAMLECETHAYRGDAFLSIAKPSLQLFPGLHKEVLDATGIDFEYENSGILNLAMNDADVVFFQENIRELKRRGFRAEWMSPDDVERNYPQLDPEYLGGAFYADDGQVNGEKFVHAVLAAARRAGAKIHESVGSVSLGFSGFDVSAVTPETVYRGKHYVVAAGAWSDEVVRPLECSLGVEPVRGQLIFYDTPIGYLKSPVFTRNNGYVVPKRSGFSLVGTTSENVGFNDRPTPEATGELSEKGRHLVPGLSRQSLRGASAGLRPKSPDDHPIIGRLPRYKNVIVATGHFRSGMLLAPITGELVASIVREKDPGIDLAPFSPARFER